MVTSVPSMELEVERTADRTFGRYRSYPMYPQSLYERISHASFFSGTPHLSLSLSLSLASLSLSLSDRVHV
jgi:hypothetical protein